MKKELTVSIIMNCYNGEKYLNEALESIIKQDYKNWELIFWDNCSTDKSKEIFKKFEDLRFKYFLAPKHTTLYQARNLAIKKATGDFICFIDTDDMWLDSKLSIQLELFSNKNIGLVYGNYWRLNEKNIINKKKIATSKKLPSGKITDDLLEEYFVGIGTVMIRREYIKDEDNVFNTEFDMLSDMDFVLRFSKKYEFACTQKPVQIHRLHDNQLQLKNFNKQVIEYSEWYENLKNSNIFGNEKKLKNIKYRSEFLKTIKLINEGFYMKSFKKIIFYPNNLDKIKLLFIFLFPKKIYESILFLR